MKFGQEPEHVRPVGRIEIAGRFVGENEGGIVDQSAGHGNALALAAAQLGGTMGQAVGQVDLGRGVERALAALTAGDTGVDEGKLDVALHVKARQEVEGLED